MKPLKPIAAALLGLLLLAATAAQAKPACPSQNFKVFLNSFSKSITVQKAFTATPLSISEIDVDSADYSFKTRKSNHSELIFPIFPSAKDKKKDHILTKYVYVNKNRAKVQLDASNSDAYSVDFLFEKQAGCWFLKHINNASL